MNLFCFFSKPFWINFNGVVWRVGLSSNSNLRTLSSLNSHIFLYYHSELVNKKVTKGCSCKPTSNKGQINSRSTFIVRLDPCLRLCVWEFCFFSSSFFFFFFQLLWTVIGTVHTCDYTVRWQSYCSYTVHETHSHFI